MRYQKLRVLIFFLLCSLFSEGIASGLVMPRIFGDNMVLQRDIPCKIWGRAIPLEKVRLEIDGESTYTYADRQGKWEASLPPHAAGGPYTLTISSDTLLKIKNVLFGEVWVASGQSNMEFRLMDISDGRYDSILSSANFPDIRYFKVERALSSLPQDDLKGGTWEICSAESIKKFSAVAWFFMKKIYDEQDVPVAIIESSWGATPAEAWTSQAMLETLPYYRKEAKNLDSLTEQEWQQKYVDADSLEALLWSIVSSQEEIKSRVAQADFDDSDWESIQLPASNMSDVVWVRKEFEVKLNKKWVRQQRELSLNLGQAYIFQDIFLNGVKLKYKDLRDIRIPASEIRNGENILAIRATSPWSNLVHIGKKNEMYLATPDGDKIVLEGEWKYSNQLEPSLPEVTYFHQEPAHIFNAMINPIAGYSMKGVIWYQGESNREYPGEYYPLFTSMIQDWRTHWRMGNFPFLYVQLANYLFHKDQPSESGWAEVREAQRKALVLPNTGMAVAIDIGESRNIHPFNKKDVGERLYLNALKLAYGCKGIVSAGPLPVSWTKSGKDVTITFTNVAGGLRTKDQMVVEGFAIAGEDDNYFWAEAQIDGDAVVIGSGDVPDPVKIRYAWADNPICNLYNSKMLPASPFQIELTKKPE